jgi:acyl-CoA thioester hydrolase
LAGTQHFTALFDQSTSILFHEFAAPPLRRDDDLGWADVVQRTEYKAELLVGSIETVRSAVVAVGRTSISYRHEMLDLTGCRLSAVMEGKAVRFSRKRRKAVELEPDLASAARAAAADF